jgi:hypothetical protein
LHTGNSPNIEHDALLGRLARIKFPEFTSSRRICLL